MRPGWRIERSGLTHPDVRALVDLHVRNAHAISPPGQTFALDLSGLADPRVALWALWEGDTLLGIGALRDLGDGTGELKSMRTVPAHLRRGVAAALLAHLIGEARRSGHRAVLLETGATPEFAPARAMYERAGFRRCPPFGSYVESDFNWCYALPLDDAA